MIIIIPTYWNNFEGILCFPTNKHVILKNYKLKFFGGNFASFTHRDFSLFMKITRNASKGK